MSDSLHNSLQQRAIKQIIHTISDDDLRLMINEISQRISQEVRTIPVFYKFDNEITDSVENMIHFLEFLIDMHAFETSDILNNELRHLLNDIYNHLSEAIEQLKINRDRYHTLVNGVNIYYALANLPSMSPIDSEHYQTIINRLSEHQGKGYEKYYVFDQAHVGDYVFIYYLSYYYHEIYHDLFDKDADIIASKKSGIGIGPLMIYQVMF